MAREEPRVSFCNLHPPLSCVFDMLPLLTKIYCDTMRYGNRLIINQSYILIAGCAGSQKLPFNLDFPPKIRLPREVFQKQLGKKTKNYYFCPVIMIHRFTA